MDAKVYFDQAEHNLKVAAKLSAGKPFSLQWAVTCAFYAGLHYVNAYLQNSASRVPKSHRDRDHNVREHMREVHNAYRELRMKSEQARYCLLYPDKKIYSGLQQNVIEIKRFVKSRLAIR